MNERLYQCNDYISFAALTGNPETRRGILQNALTLLDKILENFPKESVPVHEPAVLNPKIAMERNRWGVDPKSGDQPLSELEYLETRRYMLVTELGAIAKRRMPLASLRPFQPAVGDIHSHHGINKANTFIKGCWRNYLLFDLHECSNEIVNAVRGEAFGLDLITSREELNSAMERGARSSADSGFSIHELASELAQIDLSFRRKVTSLENTVLREFKITENELEEIKKKPYSSFVRGLFALAPTYVALAKLFLELKHFSSDDTQKSDFELKSVFVEERAADITQMTLSPVPVMLLKDDWSGLSPQARKRRLDFWHYSRIQINDEFMESIKNDFASDGFDAEKWKKDLHDKATNSLDKSQSEFLKLIEFESKMKSMDKMLGGMMFGGKQP